MWTIFKYILTYCLSVYSVKCQKCDKDHCNSKTVNLKSLFSNPEMLEKYQNSDRDRIIYIETSGWWFDIYNLDWSNLACFVISFVTYTVLQIEEKMVYHLFQKYM